MFRITFIKSNGLTRNSRGGEPQNHSDTTSISALSEPSRQVAARGINEHKDTYESLQSGNSSTVSPDRTYQELQTCYVDIVL